ncbi:hypothetical protein V1478_014632 [Vespula squamosa]|uniref:Uncharacterized protein n=1 Tax=Vespula squamosa TaxID=30214 RepID=A0ABD2A2U3_VESSQ
MPFGLGAASSSTESSRRPPRVVDAFAVSSVRCPRTPSQFGVLVNLKDIAREFYRYCKGLFVRKVSLVRKSLNHSNGQAGVRGYGI